MSKYIDRTRVVYWDDTLGNLTIPGGVNVGDLTSNGFVTGNLVHYDDVNKVLVFNQSGGSGGDEVPLRSTVVFIGCNAGFNPSGVGQGAGAIAIGANAAFTAQGSNSIAIGRNAGSNSQGVLAVAMGFGAGCNSQGCNTIAFGNSAGNTTQGNFSVAIGANAGCNAQGQLSVAVGGFAGRVSQGSNAVAIGFDSGRDNQGSNAISIGWRAGFDTQRSNAVAIGFQAGHSNQSNSAVAIGYRAGSNAQQTFAVSVGANAGQVSQQGSAVGVGGEAGMSNQGGGSVAVGFRAGQDTQGSAAIAVGEEAGQITQGASAVAVGYSAGYSNQSVLAIAIGDWSARYDQGEGAVAIGSEAGYSNQGCNAVAIGNDAGYSNQLSNAVAVGYLSGKYDQQTDAVAIGYQAGYSNQDNSAVAIGRFAGASNQLTWAVAIGDSAGSISQQIDAVAIGDSAGYNNQGDFSVAVGVLAGYESQSTCSVAIGNNTGDNYQGAYAVAIGSGVARVNQGLGAIAVGCNAAYLYQDTGAIAIGEAAGSNTQGTHAIAIGTFAGNDTQGSNAIAIGYFAGQTNQISNSIIINAGSAPLDATTNSGFYVNPVRNDESVTTGFVHYDTVTKELVYNSVSGASITSSYTTLYASTLRVSTIAGFSPITFVDAVKFTSSTTFTVPIVSQSSFATQFFAAGTTSISGIQEYAATAVSTWTTRTTPNLDYLAIAWSPDLNIFTATGVTDGMYSTDGINWTISYSAAPGTNWRSVCWSPALAIFCAVCLTFNPGGPLYFAVMTSSDGITWGPQSVPSTLNATWYGICWSEDLGLFCAVSIDGLDRVMTSPDGTTWSLQFAAELNEWTSICWSSELGLFCAVARTGTNRVMTSSNGFTWSAHAAASADSWSSVCWSSQLGLFCAVATGSANFMTSPDGSNWTTRAAPVSSTWNSVTWSPDLGLFCAVNGSGDGPATSSDGITWTLRPTAIGETTQEWSAITWSPALGKFVAVSGANGTTAGAMTTDTPTPYPYQPLYVADISGSLRVTESTIGTTARFNILNASTIGGFSPVTFTDAVVFTNTATFNVPVQSETLTTSSLAISSLQTIGSKFIVNSLRNDEAVPAGFVHYDPATKELVYNAVGGGGNVISTYTTLFASTATLSTFTGSEIVSTPYTTYTDSYFTVNTFSFTSQTFRVIRAGTISSYEIFTATQHVTGNVILARLIVNGVEADGQFYNGTSDSPSVVKWRTINTLTPIHVNEGDSIYINHTSLETFRLYNCGCKTNSDLDAIVRFSPLNSAITTASDLINTGIIKSKQMNANTATFSTLYASTVNMSTIITPDLSIELTGASGKIAVGAVSNQNANTIVFNASGLAINASTASAFYARPIRVLASSADPVLKYNTTTFEVTYDTGKTFVINHPSDSDKYLVHGCLEGPELGVYYRGKSCIPNNSSTVRIELPSYASALAREFTIQITPIFVAGAADAARVLSASEVVDGAFTVHGEPGPFFWHVHGLRGELEVEPLKSVVKVEGDGPYKWISGPRT